MDSISFNKLFYKIGEVSRLTGLKEHVIRFWESEFVLLKPKKNRGGQRVFKDNDIRLLLDIKKMLYEEGYTIPGARKALVGRKKARKISRSPSETTIESVKKELKNLLEMM